MYRRTWMPVLAAILLGGCIDTATNPTPDLGTASGEISGAVETSFDGRAVFGADIPEVGGYAISIDDGGARLQIGVLSTTAGRPEVGTYPIGEESSELFAELNYLPRIDAEVDTYTSVIGILEITSSTSERLIGELAFNAMSESAGAVEVAVTFEATCLSAAAYGC